MSSPHQQGLDRTHPPGAGSQVPFHFPDFQSQRLANGMQLLIAPYGRVPLVQAHLVMSGGGQHDPADLAGLATLTASLLDEGTTQSNALEIAAAMENLGGYLATSADWNATYASLRVLSRHLRAGLELLTEVLTGATYPAEELERLRLTRLAEIQRRQAQPTMVAHETLLRSIYDRHPYARTLAGTEASVVEISRRHVVDFARTHVTPEDATLILTGDLDPETHAGLVTELLESWHGTASEPPRLDLRQPPRERAVTIVDRPGAAQAVLRVGHSSVSRNHPDWTALEVLNTLLGGKFSSRLNLNLRERLGSTYGVRSRFAARLGPGPFIVSTSVDNESVHEAIREILSEMERLREELVEIDELEETKSYLLGVFPYGLQSIEGLAQRLEQIAVFGLRDNHFDTYRSDLRNLSRETILRVAREHLDPDRATIVVVGPADLLDSQLTALDAHIVFMPNATRHTEDGNC